MARLSAGRSMVLTFIDAMSALFLFGIGLIVLGLVVAYIVEIKLRDGRKRIIRARKGVVVAAGALASSHLLYKSGILQAGHNISLNIACPVVALMPEGKEMNVWDEDQMATYVERFV